MRTKATRTSKTICSGSLPEKETTMKLSELKSKLGLAANATEAQVTAALDAAVTLANAGTSESVKKAWETRKAASESDAAASKASSDAGDATTKAMGSQKSSDHQVAAELNKNAADLSQKAADANTGEVKDYHTTQVNRHTALADYHTGKVNPQSAANESSKTAYDADKTGASADDKAFRNGDKASLEAARDAHSASAAAHDNASKLHTTAGNDDEAKFHAARAENERHHATYWDNASKNGDKPLGNEAPEVPATTGFMTLVNELSRSKGLNFTDAWANVKMEHPEQYQAMSRPAAVK
jgi:hypothetical protein